MAPKDAEGKPAALSNGQRLVKDGQKFEFPPAPGYLVSWLQALGWSGRGDMRMVPLSAMEIQAWSAGTAHALAPWEFEALMAASAAYVTEFYAENPHPPTNDEEQDATAKAAKAKSVMSAFKNLAQKVNKTP